MPGRSEGAARFRPARVTAIIRATADAVVLTLDAPPPFRALRPGQSVTLRAAIENQDIWLRRASPDRHRILSQTPRTVIAIGITPWTLL